MDMRYTDRQGTHARHYNKDQLAAAMREARAHLLAQVDDLTDAQWQVPYHAHLNPIAWELGHIAWFAEWWTLRGPHDTGPDGRVRAQVPARYAGPDEVFDSSLIPHQERWRISLPDRPALYDRLAAQLEATLTKLQQTGTSDAELYLYRLVLFHEDMHAEAFTYLRSHLGLPPPPGIAPPSVPAEARRVHLAAGDAWVGQPRGGQGFYFDNEKWAHRVMFPALEVDATPVSSAAFLRFVEAGGYDCPEWWPGENGAWRRAVDRSHPQAWRRAATGWQYRWFDQWLPLAGDLPVMHVNRYEAEAYCRWSRGRLLTDAEWEVLAQRDVIEWRGTVWEWMADPFVPYAGFCPDWYRDYSAPWFGSHHCLRGASFATPSRIHHPQFRNFYRPERSNIFAGFRTCHQ